MRTSLRSLLVTTTVIAILLAIGMGLWRLKNHINDSIINSYRLSSAGELFIAYKQDTGEWPQSWESLEKYVNETGFQILASSFEDFKANIEIDFSVDLSTIDLKAMDPENAAPIHIIKARTGQIHGAVGSPNEMIYNQLREDAEKQP